MSQTSKQCGNYRQNTTVLSKIRKAKLYKQPEK